MQVLSPLESPRPKVLTKAKSVRIGAAVAVVVGLFAAAGWASWDVVIPVAAGQFAVGWMLPRFFG